MLKQLTVIFLQLYEPFWIEEADVWRVERTNEVNPRAHVRFLKISEFNLYSFRSCNLFLKGKTISNACIWSLRMKTCQQHPLSSFWNGICPLAKIFKYSQYEYKKDSDREGKGGKLRPKHRAKNISLQKNGSGSAILNYESNESRSAGP